MSALEKLTREISAAMDRMPGPFCGRMAWRIHPSDHARVCKELKEFCYDRQQDYRPLYALHILGIRIQRQDGSKAIMLEVDIEAAANKVLSKEGWLCLKVKFSESGYPDRLYIHLSGLHVWVEYKRNETQTEPYPLQDARLRNLGKRNVYATWTDNANDAIHYCRAALASAGIPSGRYQNATGARGSSFVPGSWPWQDESSVSSTEDPQSSYVNQ